MAFPDIHLIYTVPAGGAPGALLQAAVAAVAVPQDVLDAYGLRLISDATVLGPPVVRTIHLSAAPTATAVATAQINTLLQGSPIVSFTVTAPGAGYILPPVVLVADPAAFTPPHVFDPFLHPGQGRGARGQAYLNVGPATAVAAAGAGYDPSTTVAFVGGFPLGNLRRSPDPELLGADPPAGMGPFSTRTKDAPAGGLCVASVGMLARGRHYDPGTTVEFLGTQAPGGRQAKGVPLFGANDSIVGVRITDPGSGYITSPQVIFHDPVNAHPDAPLRPRPDTLQGEVPPNALLARATCSMARGTPATGHLTFGGGGTLTGIVVDTPGDGYVAVPQAVLTDPTGIGSGGLIAVSMSVGRIDVLSGGKNYIAPGVQLLPAYESAFLLALNRSTAPAIKTAFFPLVNLMTAAIAAAAASPVVATVPN